MTVTGSGLTLRDKLLYSAGYIGISTTEGIIASLAMYFYTGTAKEASTPALAPVLLISAAFLVARVIDSVADPIIAHFSDKCASPLGRRVPFLRWFSLPLVLSMILIFNPPTHGSSVLNGVYLLLMLSVFFATFTAYAAPYLALLPEVTRDGGERVGMSSFLAVASLVGTIIGTVASVILKGIYGYSGMAWLLGLVSLAFLLVPAFGFDEKRFSKGKANNEGMLESFMQAATTKPFVIYLLSSLGFWFGFNIIRSQLVYFVVNLIGRRDTYLSLYMGIVFGVCILSFPLINLAARRFGNKGTFIGCMVIDAVIFPALAFLGVPETVAQRSLLGMVLLGVAGVPLAGLLVLPNAILSDITDYDEMRTGRRREAMFFAAQGFLSTFSLGLSSVVVGVLFSVFGEVGATRAFGPVAGVFILIAIGFMLAYPEDKVKSGQA